MKVSSLLAGMGLAATLAFAASSASAAVNLGVLTAGPAGLSSSVNAPTGAYSEEFDFTINPPPLSVYGQLVNFAVSNISGTFDSGTLSLYDASNTLLGSGALGGLPGFVMIGATPTVGLFPGAYHIQVTGNVSDPLGANFTLGVFGAAVPEPATWATMIAGLGMLGGALRFRNARKSVASVA
jgi:hypothetical protein